MLRIFIPIHAVGESLQVTICMYFRVFESGSELVKEYLGLGILPLKDKCNQPTNITEEGVRTLLTFSTLVNKAIAYPSIPSSK